MERWLARELCFHRDPSLVRFHTGAGPRGTLDLSAARRHLAVENARSGTNSTIFTSGSGNFTVPPGYQFCDIAVYGPGGGGGGNFGAGGGGGGCCIVVGIPIIAGQSFSYVVGAGGVAGFGTTDGTNGGQSSVSSIYIANGGRGGQSNGVSQGAFGGTASGGTTNLTGNSSAGIAGSVGGNGAGPAGGLGGTVDTGSGGNPGSQPGGGGSGASAAGRTGGNGGAGEIIFVLYNSTIPHYAGIVNNSKSGLSFSPHTYSPISSFTGNLTDTDPAQFQRFYDPRGTASALSDISFGVNDDFTVLCWVHGDETAAGPLMGLQGRFTPTGNSSPYGLRGWTFGVNGGSAPYLEMNSHKIASGFEETSASDYGTMLVTSDIGPETSSSIQEWNHVACVYRGSQIPWGLNYSNGGAAPPVAGNANEYKEAMGWPSVARRPFISFHHNGRNLRGNVFTQENSVWLKKTSGFKPASIGSTYSGTDYTVTTEPVFSVGSELQLDYANSSNTAQVYSYFNGAGCLFRVYNRALSDEEITDIYSRERNLLSYKAFDAWPPAEAIGSVTLYLVGNDSNQGGVPLYAYGSQPLTGSCPLFAYGNGNQAWILPLFALSFAQQSGSVPLYTAAIGTASQTSTLYTLNSQPLTKQSSLFALSFLTDSLSVPLFVHGSIPQTVSIPLFAAIDSIPTKSASVQLSATGSLVKGMTSAVSLFTPTGSGPFVKIPLFAKGPDVGFSSRLINLFASGVVNVASSSVDLVAWAAMEHANFNRPPIANFRTKRLSKPPRTHTLLSLSDAVTLFVQGDGVTEGALPIGTSVNLVLKRNPTAAVTLYAHAPGEPLESSLDLFTLANTSLSAAVNLSAPNIIGLPTLPVKLYTTGF